MNANKSGFKIQKGDVYGVPDENKHSLDKGQQIRFFLNSSSSQRKNSNLSS